MSDVVSDMEHALLIPPHGEGLLSVSVRRRGGVTGGAGSLRPFSFFAACTTTPAELHAPPALSFRSHRLRSFSWSSPLLALLVLLSPVGCWRLRRPGHWPPSSSTVGSLMLPSSSRRHGGHADQRLGRRSSSFAILKHAHSLSCCSFVLGSFALSASLGRC